MSLPDCMFRTLDSEEESQFRMWAVNNFVPGKPANECWHPVVREQWRKMQESFDELKTKVMAGGK